MPNTNEQLSREQQIAALEKDWATNPRGKGIKRGYSAADVVRLRGSLPIEYTLAKRGAEKLWGLVNGEAKKGYVNAFELMKNMIAAGAAGVHFEDQLAAVKKCGHMGGKVLVPTQEACEKLIAARFAADVMGSHHRAGTY